MQLWLKPREARGIEPETFERRGQLLSRPPATGPNPSGMGCLTSRIPIPVVLIAVSRLIATAPHPVLPSRSSVSSSCGLHEQGMQWLAVGR